MDEPPGTMRGARGRLSALRERLTRERVTPDLAAVDATEGVGGGPSKAPARVCFCLNCGYELTGIDWSPAACPECGEAFDPEDAASTSAVRLEKARRAAVLRVMWGVLIGLAIVSGLMYTVIPRPERPDNWRLWVWFGQRWGADRVWLGKGPGWVYYWAGRAYAAEREADGGGLAWEMAVEDGNDWTLKVYEAGVEWRELMRPFNAIKRDMFGIVFSDDDRGCAAPFEVTGDRIDVMSALARTYDLHAASFIMRDDQAYVWVFDASRGEMRAVDIESAEALGFEVRRQSSQFDERKLIPRPTDDL